MSKVNDTPRPLLSVLGNLPQDMPIELIQKLSTWDKIIKSPYGHSYYNASVGWDFKEHGSYRIADHWNFYSKGGKHCETTVPVPSSEHYTIARYDATIKKYIPVASYPKTKDVKKTVEYRIIQAKAKLNHTIEAQSRALEGIPSLEYYLGQTEIKYAEQLAKLIEEKLGKLK